MRSTIEKLGSTTNLLCGYNPNWLSKGVGNDALFMLPAVSTNFKSARLGVEKGQWSFPFVSLHDHGESLMDTLLPYKVCNPSDGSKEATMPAGALLLGNKDRETALEILSNTLGVDLTKPNTGYALVQLKRIDGKEVHPGVQSGILVHPNPVNIPEELGITDDFTRAAASLKRMKIRGAAFSSDEVTKADAEEYLHLFARNGTHFISTLTLGDVIFQVYAIEGSQFKRVKERYAKNPGNLSGVTAVTFRQFTSEFQSGNYGYVTQYGKILSFSQSKKLTETLAKGDWKETIYAEADSIFSVFENGRPLNLNKLNTGFTDQTEVVKELTSLTLLVEYSRRQIWRRVFAAAAVQIYKSAIQPHFDNYSKYDPKALQQENELPGFLTNIATPTINAYRPGLDLSTLTFVAEEQVKSFTLYSNLISNNTSSNISIPGTDVLICGQVYALETDTYTTTIQLSNNGWKSFALYAQQFYGGLLVQNAANTEHFTIVDGLRYQTTNGANGRFYVKIDQDCRKAPEETKLTRLRQNLQFNYAFSSAKLTAIARNNPVRNLLRESLLWICAIIPENIKDKEMLELRVRALDFAHVDNGNALGSFVPVLPAKDYENQVGKILDYIAEIDKTIDSYHQQISARKTQELIIDVANKLNENIVSSGKLLAGYIDASISQQQALSRYYDAIIKQKKEEKKNQLEFINELDAQLIYQQNKVNNAVGDFRTALEGLQVKEAVKFGMLVAEDLFSLRSMISIPTEAPDGIMALAVLAERIQRLLNIVKKAVEIYDNVKEGIGSLNDMQKTFDGLSDIISANLEWDQLSVKLEGVLSSAPIDPGVDEKKGALLAEFAVLVLKGEAHTTAQANYHQIAREIYDQQQQKKQIDDHVQMMEKLNKNLNPASIGSLDKANIDLAGLTGSLSMIRSQMLGILSKSFTLQDQALQYTFLQPPTVINSFDTFGIYQAISLQNDNTIAAKEEWSKYQAATTTPIAIEVEVPVADLRNGKSYRFSITPEKDFYKYVNTRVMAVVAKIDGIQSTTSGNYLLELKYGGRPFYDRNYDRTLMTFNTISRTRIYEYEVQDNKPLFSDKGDSWSKDVNPITPFSTWYISLPEGGTNKELRFIGLKAKFTLTFVLEARIHEASARLTDSLYERQLRSAGAKSSITELLSEMHGKTVLNGWDVVFSMSLAKINAVLKAQFEELKNNPTFKNEIDVEPATKSGTESKGKITVFTLKRFTMKYSYPKLQFLTNSERACELEMQIESGSVTEGFRRIGENTPEIRKILKNRAEEEDLSEKDIKEIDGGKYLQLDIYNDKMSIANSKLITFINLEAVKGLVNSDKNIIMSVVLDMSKGTFEPKNMNIVMNPDDLFTFSDSVNSYFKSNSVYFILNSLDLTGISTLPDLRPHQFLLKVFTKGTENAMLRLFIQTNYRSVESAGQASLNILHDGIPSDSECSLMISSKLFFNSLLPGSIVNGWRIQGVDHGKGKAWSAKFMQASVTAAISLKALDRQILSGSNPTTRINYRYWPDKSDTNWLLTDMTITPSQIGQMEMSYEGKSTFAYVENVEDCTYTCRTSEKKLSTDVNLKVNAKLPVEITGSGRDQGIQVNKNNMAVVLDAKTSGGGPCGGDNLESRVNAELQKKVPDRISEKINVKFDSISVFALKNLLFPSNNYINLKEVYVPGDLLIVGKFITQK